MITKLSAGDTSDALNEVEGDNFVRVWQACAAPRSTAVYCQLAMNSVRVQEAGRAGGQAFKSTSAGRTAVCGCRQRLPAERHRVNNSRKLSLGSHFLQGRQCMSERLVLRRSLPEKVPLEDSESEVRM